MDSIHDLGGRQGFGGVEREIDEPVFHGRWEAAVFTMTRTARACGALQNTDQFRHAIERTHPVAYLTHGYYGRWLGGLENLFTEAGLVVTDELNERVLARGGDPRALVAARPDPDFGPLPESSDDSASRPLSRAPRFALGESVRTAAQSTNRHTRLPWYARQRIGEIVALHAGWVYPDSNAHGDGEQPQHLYTVAFTGQELWGPEAEPGIVVHLDLFEPYLDRIEER